MIITNNNSELGQGQPQVDYGPEFEECIIKMRRGFWTVVFLATVSLIFAIIQNISQGFTAILSSGLFIDAVVIAIFALGVYRKSRASITIVLLYYIASKVLTYYVTGTINGTLIVILLLLFLSQATYSTYKYHSIRKKYEPTYKATSKLTWWLATPFYVLFSVVYIYSFTYSFLYAALDWGPTLVTRASQFSSEHREAMVAKSVIQPAERVEIFYSRGVYSLWTGGSLVTSDRVIGYEMSEEQLLIASAAYENIAFVGIEQKGNEDSYSHIYIETVDGKYFYLNAPAENKVDELIVNTIKTKVRLSKVES